MNESTLDQAICISKDGKILIRRDLMRYRRKYLIQIAQNNGVKIEQITNGFHSKAEIIDMISASKYLQRRFGDIV